MTNAQSKAYFRFFKQDIRNLSTLLGVPEALVLPNRCVVPGEEGFCIFLRRLAYPNRLLRMEPLFNRPKSTLSLTIQQMLDILYDNHNHRLTNMNQDWITTRLQQYADHIHQKEGPLSNCFAFIDGTVRPISRPTIHQRVCYNGHEHIHALKFQSVVAPDGMNLN